MLFIVEYKRSRAMLLSLQQFDEDNDEAALKRLCSAEQTNVDDDIEIVLISAASEESLREGYPHYFVRESVEPDR
ncbi:MAG: hypothetical protein ABIQ38_07965 [Ilumatobacteraceae bacterium]